jgi:zinc transport system ATP-binding protein
MTLIAARDLSVGFDGRKVLHGVDMEVARGEIVTLVGPNGSGKSTLVRALVGAVRPGRGRIERAAGLRVGYVPQRLALDPAMPLTVDRLMALPGRGTGGRGPAGAALDRVGMSDTGGRQVADLSGGQLQRVLLARALATGPDLLVLDEPTQGLDQPGTAAFYRLIEEVRADTGAGVLLVSHDLHVVMSASDRVICLNGHVCCHGTPAVVRAAPEYRALFGLGTGGALALYRHVHDHVHDDDDAAAGPGHDQDHEHGHAHDHSHGTAESHPARDRVAGG